MLLDRGQDLVVPEAGLYEKVNEDVDEMSWIRTCCIGPCPQSEKVDEFLEKMDWRNCIPSQLFLSVNFQCNDLQSQLLPDD